VVTDTGQRWNISPHLLSPIKNVQAGMVVDIRPKNEVTVPRMVSAPA